MSRDTIGNSLRQAKAIRSNVVIKEQVGRVDQGDFYRLRLIGLNRLSIHLKSSHSQARLNLIQDQNNNGRIDRTDIIARSRASNTSNSIQLPRLPGGTYFLRVFSTGRGATNYQLVVDAQTLPADTPSNRFVPNLSSLPQSDSPNFIDQVTQLTNTFRQQNGLQPLTPNSKLNTAAQTHSQAMAVQDFFSHIGLDGSKPWDRINTAGYQWSRASENIAAGQKTPEDVVNAWINSPSHRKNMLDPEMREIGIGYYEQIPDMGGVNYYRYWTQVFATPS